ncbi:MAG: outer membrane lipoprotein LolB [Pseudohongiellaceae bacterium]|jgi:outer membrane lipoprotein LolB
MLKKTLLLPALSLSLILGGCSHTPPNNTGLWLTPEQQQANQQIHHWQIGGKIGLRSEQSSDTGYLNWQQCNDDFEIRLTGPLGQGAAILYGNQNNVTLKTKEGTRKATSPEQLLAQQGWQLPVSQLKYWVRGIPAPQFDVTQQTSEGFTQMGWHVRFTQWQNIYNHRLPKKAIATHPELKVTLLLKNWGLKQECAFSMLESA